MKAWPPALVLAGFALVAASVRAQQPRPSPSPSSPSKTTPSYGDEDLDRAAGRPPAVPGKTAAPPSQAAAPPAEAGDPAVNRVDESESAVPEDSPVQRVNESGESSGGGQGWAERAQGLRDAIAAAEKRVQDLDSEAQALLWKYLQSTDTNEILSLKAEQQELLDQLPDARKEAADARKALEDFEREAAQAGVPPGELREKKKP